MSPAEVAAARLKETVRLPMVESTAARPGPARAASVATWWNPFSWKRPVRSGAAVFGAEAGRLAVQGELSLDQIKVIRNDLSDSDVEIVQPDPGRKPRGLRAVSEPQPALEEAPRS